MSLVSPVYRNKARFRPLERGAKHYLSGKKPVPSPVTGRIWLQVPYEERNLAKAQGAKWDAIVRFWYASTHDSELQRFKRWMPKY